MHTTYVFRVGHCESGSLWPHGEIMHSAIIVLASELIDLRVFKEVHQPKDSKVVVDAKSAPKLFLGKRSLWTREAPT
jgi:hypothetical protein